MTTIEIDAKTMDIANNPIVAKDIDCVHRVKVAAYDPIYPVNEKNKGQVLIFNHFEYDKKVNQKKRQGTQIDGLNLKETFEQLNFQVQLFNDEEDVLGELEKVKENKELLLKTDCLIVIVMTHGERNHLYAFNKMYLVESLWKMFYASQCPELLAKPKIFIIQACRGHAASQRAMVQKVQTDSMNFYSIPEESDMLVAFSSFEDKVAFRDTDKGSWYIQELCEELRNSLNLEDFLSILTNVNRNVAVKYEYCLGKQMPIIQSTFLRKLYLGEIPKEKSNKKEKFDRIENQLTDIDNKIDTLTKIVKKDSVGAIRKLSSRRTQRDSISKQDDSNFIATVTLFLEDNPNIKKDLKDNLECFVSYLKGIDTTFETKMRIYTLIKENSNWKYIKMLKPLERNQ